MDVSSQPRLTAGAAGSTALLKSTDRATRSTWRSPAASRRGTATATVGRVGMWVFLATDTMGFAALLLAYAVLRTRSYSWPDPASRTDRPLGSALTFTLLLSGASMSAAVAAARRGERSAARMLIALTAVAGMAFVAGQAVEFRALAIVRHVGLTADHAAATFYVITAYHGLHVLVGVLWMVIIGARRKIWDDPGPAGRSARVADILDVTSLYWQFVDVVWIVLFTVLYLLPGVVRGQ